MERFNGQCQAANITGHLVQESGDLGGKDMPTGHFDRFDCAWRLFSVETVEPVLQNCGRPVLVVPGEAADFERVLLVYEGQSKSQEALFVAAYLAEQLKAALTVLTEVETSGYAARYLEMHEVEAKFVTEAVTAVAIQQTAAAHNSDLILLNYNGRRQFKNIIAPLLVEGERPLFICP